MQLTGERGLVLAIIGMAYDDLTFGNAELRQDAQRYFNSDTYQRHLSLLGMPACVKPVGVGK